MRMAEYIEREALMKKAIEEKRFVFQMEDLLKQEIVVKTVYKDFFDFIKSIPAADVAPVRHGRWIFEPDGGTRCSECNKRVRDVTGGLNAPVDLSELPYCPKCGAKMDGGESNERMDQREG